MDCQSDNTGSPTFTPPRERERERERESSNNYGS